MESVKDTISRRRSLRESGSNWKQKIMNRRKSVAAPAAPAAPAAASSSSSPNQTVAVTSVSDSSSLLKDTRQASLATMPPELLLQIFAFLNFASLFPLKVAGSRYLTSVASSIPRPSSAEYMAQVQNIVPEQKNGRSALHVAVLWQQEKLVEGLLSRHSRATSQDDLGNTPLHDAAVLGLNNMANILINSRRYTIFVRNQEGQIPLHLAVRNGNEDLIQLMMKYGNGDQMVRITDSARRTPLHYASEAGQDHLVSLLLKGRGSRVLDKDVDGNSPLHLAAANGHLETLKLLLRKKSVTLSERNKAGKTCLHMACASGHEAMVYFLVRKSSLDIATRDFGGSTPLHEVARNGSDELIKMLLHMEMNPTSSAPAALSTDSSPKMESSTTPFMEKNINNFTDTLRQLRRGKLSASGNTTISTKLHFAASLGSERAVTELLESGSKEPADVNTADVNGFTPLHRAALSGSAAIVRILLTNGAGLSTTDNMNRTALHLAVGVEAVEVARLLISEGIDVNAKDAAGNTALHIAATIPNEDTLRLLTQQEGILINGTNEQKDVPLHKGSKAGNVAAVKLLLEKNADVKARNKCGANALMFAIEYGHAEVVNLLLEKNSDIMQKRADGKRALDIATMKWKSNSSEDGVFPLKPFEGILRRLLEKLANCPPSYKRLDSSEVYEQPILHLAAQLGELEIVQIASERRNVFDPSTLNKHGEPAVFLAAMYGHEETVRFLSGKGFLDLRLAVKLAAKAGNENAIRLLLHEEPDYPRLTGDFGEALCLAAAGGHEGMVKLLLQKGADPKSRDDSMGYPLISAAAGGHEGIIELLLGRGAQVDTRDIQDLPNNDVAENTPLLAAIKAGHIGAVSYLLRRGAVFDELIRTQAYPVLLGAAMTGNKPMVEFLLARGIGEKPPAYDRDGVLQPAGPTLLAAAAKGGQTEIISLLLKEPNVNVNSPCKYSRPPLTEAVVGGHKDCVQQLLDAGADVNMVYLGPNTFPETALMVAASKDNEEVIKLLLDSGAGPNVVSGAAAPNVTTTVSTPLTPAKSALKNRARYTPLAEAAASGNLAIVKLLLENGADINFNSGRRGTPLRAAAERGHEEICKFLLERDALLSHVDSPLVGAVTEGHTEIVKMLLDARKKTQFGLDYDESKDFKYAMRAAAEKGKEDVLRLILEAEDAKKRHELLDTALVLCLRHHHNSLASVVLDIGTSYFVPCDRLNQALRLAIDNGVTDIVERLLAIGAVEGHQEISSTPMSSPTRNRPPPPSYFCFQDDRGFSRRFISSARNSRNLDAENALGALDLLEADDDDSQNETKEETDPAEVLYNRYNSLINVTSTGAASAYSRIAKFLLESVASIHEQDSMGRTPLMVALEGRKPKETEAVATKDDMESGSGARGFKMTMLGGSDRDVMSQALHGLMYN